MAFKSLEDIYANQCAGKPVVPLQRHVITEQYYVTLSDNKTQVVKNQQISPELYAKFRREVSRTSNVQIGSQTHTVNEVIDMIMKVDRWHVGNKNYEGGFLGPVLNIFNTVDTDPAKFAALYQLQTNTSNPIRSQLLNNPGTAANLYSLLPKEFVEVFASKEDAVNVFNSLYEINPPIKGVAIGKGEIALTFISDAVKGTKGDLSFSSIGEVEVKGSSGRMGGDGFATEQSVDKINHTLQFVGSSLSDADIRRLKNELIANLNSLMQTVEKPEHKLILKDLATKINQDSAVQDIKNHITGAYRTGLKGLIKPLYTKMINVVNASNRAEAFSLTEAVKLFFDSIDQLPYDKFIDGVISLRNYQAQDQINNLTAAIRKLIPESNYKTFKDKSKYAPLVGALHLVCYYLREHFSYVIFVNDANKNAICFKPEKDVSENIAAAYKFFASNAFVFGFSVDPTRKSASVSFVG